MNMFSGAHEQDTKQNYAVLYYVKEQVGWCKTRNTSSKYSNNKKLKRPGLVKM